MNFAKAHIFACIVNSCMLAFSPPHPRRFAHFGDTGNAIPGPSETISPCQGAHKSECLTTRTGIEGPPFENFWHVVAVTFPSFQLPHLRSFLFCIRSSCRLSSSNQPESLFGSKCGTDGMNRKHPFIPLRLWISISASNSSRVYLVLARTLARNLVPSGWSAAPPNSQCL